MRFKITSQTYPTMGKRYNVTTKSNEVFNDMEFTAVSTSGKKSERRIVFFGNYQGKIKEIPFDDAKSWQEI